MVERQPSKLDVAGSSPVSRSIFLKKGGAGVAQSVERILGKDEVTSSNLVIGSRICVVFGKLMVRNIQCQESK